ncbi:MAG: cyclase [Bacteroidota bacterium]
MVKVILSHEVKDFATWKSGFEAGETMRSAAGVVTTGVYTAVDNANHVTITTEFPSVEAVQGFLSNPALKADMQTAGVIGAPDIRILNKVS